MKNKNIIVGVIILLIFLLVALYFAKPPSVESPTVDHSQFENRVANAVVYIDQNNQPLKVSYDNQNNTATLYMDDENSVLLNGTTSASGAKYQNDKGVTLWNKGNEVSLYVRDSLIYTGVVTKK